MTLTVEFDQQVFQAQRRGGITRYFTELIRELREHPEFGVTVSTPFRYVVNEHLVEVAPRDYRPAPARGAIRALRNAVPRFAAREPDLVHYTYYDRDALRPLRVPAVSTVHDMIPEVLPAAFPDGNPHRAKHDYVLASAGVICVSESTRNDLVRMYTDLSADVAVIPHGVGDQFRTPAPARIELPRRYVLFVGQRAGYKDWRVLVEAWNDVRELDDVELVCLGGGAFTSDEANLLRRHALTERTTQRSVADSDLPGVYARAEAFVFPSRYEGFGLPILEAFAAGCPVIAADTACFREVADTAALYFEPKDVAGLASRLSQILGDTAVRTSRVDAGRRRAADFTWSRTAELTADFYRQVAR